MYDYELGKNRILRNLKKKIDLLESDEMVENLDEYLSQDNGIRGFISVICTNLKKSRELFQINDKVVLSQMMRAYQTEIITILNDFYHVIKINIVNDLIYAIYPTTTKDDVYNVAHLTFTLNSFSRMFNKLLENNGLPKLGIGIGMATSYDTFIEIKHNDANINEFIPIGNALSTAMYLSRITGQHGEINKSIGFNDLAYKSFIDLIKSERNEAKNWFIEHDSYYFTNIILTEFMDYIASL